MHFPSKATQVLYGISLSLLVLSSSAIVADEEEMNKNRLRGNVVEDIISTKTDESGVVEEDTHHRDGLLTVMDTLLENPPLFSSYGNKDITVYDGVWGVWKPWMKTQGRGMYACGAELRFEDHIGDGDDTAANGLKFKYCGLSDWNYQQTQTIWDGNWGVWKGMVTCPFGKYIGAANIRFEDHVGDGDDTALNGLMIWCVDKDWSGGKLFIVYNGSWGSWKGWGYEHYKLVKGARVRYEDHIGNGDDTAMNGIQLNVEIPNFSVSRAQITGEWVAVASAAQGYVSRIITESTTTTTNEEQTTEEIYGFTESISAGFKVKVVDVSLSVTASQSFRTSILMSHSLQQYKAVVTTLGCPSSGSPTGYYTMWQFRMSQPSDGSGIGFKSNSNHVRCTPSLTIQPRCALGSCADKFCQKCSVLINS